MTQEEFQKLLRFFKVVADESRLRIVGLLSTREHSVDELAAILQIKAPTVSHHLARLRDLDLVGMRSEGNTHVYWLKGETLTELSRDLLTREKMASFVEDLDDGNWARKVLRDFLDGERLKGFPASRKKREVILRWLVERFEHGVRYQEKDVNAIIGRHHHDFETWRRELVGYGLLAREKGIYWRP